MSLPRRHQIWNESTITANGNSGPLPNFARSANPTIVAILNVEQAPTGTSPTLTITISSAIAGSSDFATLASFTQVTSSNSPTTTPFRLVLHDVLESQIQVSWVIGGSASPSFTGLDVGILFTSPDA